MINLHRALNNDRLMRALTGLNQQAFDELLSLFTAAWQAQLQAQLRQFDVDRHRAMELLFDRCLTQLEVNKGRLFP